MPHSLAPPVRLQRNVANFIRLLRTQGGVHTTLSMASAVIHIFEAAPPLGDYPRLESRPQRRQSYNSNDLVKKQKEYGTCFFRVWKKQFAFFSFEKSKRNPFLLFSGWKKQFAFFILKRANATFLLLFSVWKEHTRKIPTHVSMVGNLGWIVK